MSESQRSLSNLSLSDIISDACAEINTDKSGLNNPEASETDLDLMLHLDIIFESAILTPTP
jgi:hypothetical protein